ncbi:MAG: HEAT repeat domain-containing protein [Pseudomonadota bacterium]
MNLKSHIGGVGLRVGLLGLGIAGLVCFGACPKRDVVGGYEGSTKGRLKIYGVEIVDHTPESERPPGVNEKELQVWVEEQLRNTKTIQIIAEVVDGAYLMRMELGIGRQRNGEKEQMVAMVTARATVPGGLDSPPLQASAMALMEEAEPIGAQKRKHLMAVMKAVVEDLGYQAGLVGAPETELVKALSGKDADHLAAAVEIVAIRRVKSALPALVKLLRSKDTGISDRAIGALVSIGDREAVRSLTRLAKFSDTALLAKILDGVAALGGKEAVDYLSFVAVGHEDADIRNLAREALERMKNREASGR